MQNADLAGDLAAKGSVLVPEHEQLCVLGDVTAQQHHRKDSSRRVSWYSSDTITGS